MRKIHESLLPSVTGGYSSYRWLPTTVLASIAQVSSNLHDTAPNNVEHSDAASHCNQYTHKAVTPKNGDRNVQWQQYSWGTWWDDDH